VVSRLLSQKRVYRACVKGARGEDLQQQGEEEDEQHGLEQEELQLEYEW
jgi:hypothetical protein